MARPRTLIAYDHRLFLDTLALLLDEEFEIVFATNDFAIVLDALRQYRPALVVQGLSKHPAVGLQLIAEIREAAPTIAVAVISPLDDGRIAAEAFRQGADAYVLTTSTPTELLDGVRAAVTRSASASRDALDE